MLDSATVYQITVILKKLVLAHYHCPLQQQLGLVGSETHLSEAETWTTFFELYLTHLLLCSGPGYGSSRDGVSTQQNPSFSGGGTYPSHNSTTGVGYSAGVGSSTRFGYRAEAHGASSPKPPHTRTSSPEPLPRPADTLSSSVAASRTTAHQNKTQILVRPGTREIQPVPGYAHPRPQSPPTSPQGNVRILLDTCESSRFWSRFMSSTGNQSLPDQPAAPAVVNPQSQNRGFPTLQNRAAAASPTSRAQSEHRWKEKVRQGNWSITS